MDNFDDSGEPEGFAPEDHVQSAVDGLGDVLELEFLAAEVPADRNGQLSLRIPKAVQHEIEDIRDDPVYDLKSTSSVVRFCLMSGLRRLRQLKPRPTLLGAIRKNDAIIARETLQQTAIEQTKRADPAVKWFIAHKEYDAAIEFAADLRANFEVIADDSWKRFNLKELDEKFDEWMGWIEEAKAKDAGK
jgi:hypothetical protein